MKKLITMALLLLALAATNLNAANTSLGNSSKHGCKIISNTDNYTELEYNVGNLNFDRIETEKGNFTEVTVDGGYLSKEIGKPALPIFRNLLEIPFGAKAEVEIIDYDVKEYSLKSLGINTPIAPAQPSYSKSADVSEMYFRYDETEYASKKYNEKQIASVKMSGTMRGVGVGTIEIAPIKYNPATQTIKVYHNLKLKVNYAGADVNAGEIKRNEHSPYFDNSFSKLINHRPLQDKSDFTNYPVTYLIVANNQFQNNAKLQEFIKWKQQKGFKVEVNYVSSSTSTSTIDNWIENKYNSLTPKPSFLLIVGDESGTYCVKTEVDPPLGSSGSVTRSDLLYGVNGSLSSSNHIPSIHIGRFSARSVADLEAQIDKTIWYEKGQFQVSNPDLNYLTTPMGAAGVDASYATSHGNPQIRYGWDHYFNSSNGMGNAIHYLYKVYSGTNGMGSDDSNAAATIVNNISNGVNFYNYTAHGYQQGFADPSFTISNVNNLSNNGEYPLVVGNCCLTGSFGTDECFGEAWLNAPDKGAIGYIGASMSTMWNEDLAMGTGTASIVNDTNPSLSQNEPGVYDGVMTGNYPTQASARYVGLLAVENYGGNYVNNYWSAYHLFGDPSLMVYFGIPNSLTASYGTLNSTTTSFAVSTSAGAYVALSDSDGNLHGAALANSSGTANLNITNFSGFDTAQLVITGRFKKPYFATINVGGGSVNNPPACNITAPSDGAVYTIGDDIVIYADATDSAKDKNNGKDKLASKMKKIVADITKGKSVSSVKFYIDGTLKSTDSNSPYSYSWNTTATTAGNHTIKAVATDNEGSETESTTVNVIVNDDSNGSSLLYTYDFESGTQNWTIKNSTMGFKRGTGSTLSMGNGSGSNFIGVNSDAAGDGAGNVTDHATSPALDLAGSTNLKITFDYMLRRYQQYDKMFVMYRTSSSASWVEIEELAVTGDWNSWTNHTTNLPQAAAVNGAQISFFYDDNNGWGYGAGIDNVKLEGEAGAVNTPPTCSITSPANGSEYTIGNSINITANATDAGKNIYKMLKGLTPKEINGKSVASVKFYINNTLKHTDTSLPYSYAWATDGETAGSYKIKTVASDDEGATAEAEVSITLIEGGNDFVTLPYSTDFSSSDGWAQQNINCTERWASSSTNKAGGTSPEMMAKWEQKDPATARLISPEFNTAGASALTLSFKHFFDYYGSGVTIKVQSSTDAVNWTDEAWVIANPAANIGAKTETTTITENLGSGTYLALTIDGNLYQFDYWYIDDVSVAASTGSTPGPVTLINEDFENNGSLPSGWTTENVVGTTNWEFSNGGHSSKPAAAASGSYNALLYRSSTSVNSTKLITPTMDLNGVNNAKLSFNLAMKDWSPDQDELKVYYRASASSDWNLLKHYNTSIGDWTTETIELPNVSANYAIAFEGYAKYGYGVCIDDVVIDGVKSALGIDVLANEFALYQNYPNPFNPSTTISYSIPNDGNVKLTVFNAKGETVWNSSLEAKAAGKHTVEFNGNRFNSGVYYYTLKFDNQKTITKKMILIK